MHHPNTYNKRENIYLVNYFVIFVSHYYLTIVKKTFPILYIVINSEEHSTTTTTICVCELLMWYCDRPKNLKNMIFTSRLITTHSLIRGVRIQSCSTGAKNFTKCVFYHVQFSGVIQNIAYLRAIKTKFWKTDFYLIKLIILIIIDIDKHESKWFSIFWITPLNCGWQNT